MSLGQTELAADEVVEALLLERGGHEVDVRDVLVGDHVLRLDVGEERDLVAHVGRDHVARSADDDVGVDTDAPQLVHGVLGRLRLQLAGRVDVRDERDVDVEDVLCARLAPELADRLQERQRLDVADRPADLADHDVGVALLGRAADPVLDLVRDVRDHLDGLAEVVALALAAEHAVPDAALGVVRAPGEVLVEEALVVADVEVGLGAVLGDEDLAVLERAHRAGVDVEVRDRTSGRRPSGPRAFSSRPSDAAVMPLPRDETTPPVTKTYSWSWLTPAAPRRRDRGAPASVRSPCRSR